MVRILAGLGDKKIKLPLLTIKKENYQVWCLADFNKVDANYINASAYPYDVRLSNILDIVDINAEEKFYITKKGCAGILRRKHERSAGMNQRLEAILTRICEDASAV